MNTPRVQFGSMAMTNSTHRSSSPSPGRRNDDRGHRNSGARRRRHHDHGVSRHRATMMLVALLLSTQRIVPSSEAFSPPTRMLSSSLSSPWSSSLSWSNRRFARRTPPATAPSSLSSSSQDEPAFPSPPPIPIQVTPQRHVQLLYLSLLALLSDWICFSVAAAPSSFERAYPGSSASDLIDVFLFTNVVSCFFVTDAVARFGLGRSIKGAGCLMFLGCLLRSGLPDVSGMWNGLLFGTATAHAADAVVVDGGGGGALDRVASAVSEVLPDAVTDLVDPATLTEASRVAGLEPYSLIVLGTVLVGKPYFQCTPPMLSATWFAANERATATATALNFNQIGIAVAFLVGGHMANSEAGIHDYFGLITVLCGVVAVGTVCQFRDRPDFPPSYSELEKLVRGEKEPPFLESVKKLFQTKGFTIPLAAFVCSISITNIVGTFIDEVMERGGITSQLGIDLAGAGFEFAILLGGILIGGYVDETKRYKPVTLACLLATMFFVLPLGLTDHMLGNEPALLVLALLGLGMACGPIQPINAELAVDVTYPSDETAVESVQQVGGNLVSALMVPVAEWALNQDYEFFQKVRPLDMDVRGDVLLLFTVAAVTILYFSTFDAPLRRTMADEEAGGEEGGRIEGASVLDVDVPGFVVDGDEAVIAELIGK
ncbi:hypothetical protein ACHAXS_008170 [Conticribra weissflogii]